MDASGMQLDAKQMAIHLETSYKLLSSHVVMQIFKGEHWITNGRMDSVLNNHLSQQRLTKNYLLKYLAMNNAADDIVSWSARARLPARNCLVNEVEFLGFGPMRMRNK